MQICIFSIAYRTYLNVAFAVYFKT